MASFIKSAPFLFCMVLEVFAAAQYAMLMPSMWPFLHHHFHSNTMVLGFAIAAFSLGQSLTSLLCGRLYQLGYFRLPCAVFFVLMAVGNAVYSQSEQSFLSDTASEIIIISTRFVTGLGCSVMTLFMAWIASEVSTEERQAANALNSAAISLGFVIGPALGVLASVAAHKGITRQYGRFTLTLDEYTAPAVFSAVVNLLAVFVVVVVYSPKRSTPTLATGLVNPVDGTPRTPHTSRTGVLDSARTPRLPLLADVSPRARQRAASVRSARTLMSSARSVVPFITSSELRPLWPVLIPLFWLEFIVFFVFAAQEALAAPLLVEYGLSVTAIGVFFVVFGVLSIGSYVVVPVLGKYGVTFGSLMIVSMLSLLIGSMTIINPGFYGVSILRVYDRELTCPNGTSTWTGPHLLPHSSSHHSAASTDIDDVDVNYLAITGFDSPPEVHYNNSIRCEVIVNNVPTFIVFCFACVLFAAIFPIGETTIVTYATELTADLNSQSAVVSILNVISAIGTLVAPPIVTVLLEYTHSFRALFITMTGLAIPSFIAAVALKSAEKHINELIAARSDGAVSSSRQLSRDSMDDDIEADGDDDEAVIRQALVPSRSRKS